MSIKYRYIICIYTHYIVCVTVLHLCSEHFKPRFFRRQKRLEPSFPTRSPASAPDIAGRAGTTE